MTRFIYTAATLTLLLAASSIIVLGIGSVPIPPTDVIDVIARRVHLIHGDHVTIFTDRIIWELRLPRIMATIAVGAALAQCGCILQALTGNDLADPYLLGISSGAAVGAVAAIILGWTIPGLPPAVATTVTAFTGAIAALALVLGLATGRSGALPPGRTILAGIAISQLAGAFTSFVVMIFGGYSGAREVMTWMLGSFSGIRAPHAWLITITTLLATTALITSAPALDAFAFGETSARSLGIRVEHTRWALFTGCALLTATTVATVGPIGFVGLTIPHIMRLIIGPTHRRLLPASALAGALLLLWSDTAARALNPGQEIPIGVITAAIGAPVLVALLRNHARHS
ncbi:Vitamin B12 import system permease protein BtuC [Dermatophilus congolensis]|uniref:Vitamin B12 import system permease protein BtuC n=1 Tax=Dermatophilus congolensis TaxID=1863 RepID=A0AA46H1J9_9MICO|nr:iron chelate uptake ABC transporter family permease subunit [Dermatophilus congolensis]STD15714.1 Vitamin B12 import system permease protein BtuC [Dermatophilus congolensis]